MKIRNLLCAALVLTLCGDLFAADPSKIPMAAPLERRVEDLESKVATLEKQVQALRDANYRQNNPPIPPSRTKVAGDGNPFRDVPAVQYRYEYQTKYQCDGNSCRPVTTLVQVPVTQNAGSGWPTWMSPTQSGVSCTNCTTCGDNCQCFGGGYYCSDGNCPVQAPNAGGVSQTSFNSVGSAGTQRTGLFSRIANRRANRVGVFGFGSCCGN